jgi:tetratricopeptide (TPR) repeat protein
MSTEATETGREDAGLAEMLHDLEMGRDEQLCETDYETRYNLGIAYREVGLIDEAISEFRLAATDEGHVLDCSSMLGLCFIEKGMPELAMEWFEKGLQAVGWWERVEMS